jgi:transposase
MPDCQQLSASDLGPFSLRDERLGVLPLINAFIERLDVAGILDRHVPTDDRRCRLGYAKSLGVLLRALLVEREPMYRQETLVRSFAPKLFGLTSGDIKHVSDDALGRALDRLFQADRSALVTDVVVAASRNFNLRLDELHNDSTSVKFVGQYRASRQRGGKTVPWITFGYSKDHRPDLKQLVLILTTTADGGVPVQFRCADGNTNDAVTHIETWEALRRATSRPDFLYVADCKLCSYENMRHIHSHGGRFVTVMPRSRKEDDLFREWAQTHEIPWQPAWDRVNPRRRHGPRDRWFTFRWELPSQEGWPVTWVYSTLLELKQRQRRLEHLHHAIEQLAQLDRRLQGPRPRRKVGRDLDQQVREILERFDVVNYLRIEYWTEERHRFRQERRGRTGANTRFRRETHRRLRLRWTVCQDRIDYDQKTDGMYPLLTNDRNLSPLQVLEAHKNQPRIEKRFEQLKTVHEIAPVFLKSPARIEAFFLIYFLALLVQALIERHLRQAMHRASIDRLPLYPEGRSCANPTFQQLLRLFANQARHLLLKDGSVVQTFHPELTPLHRQVLQLLNVPIARYQ